MRVPLRPLAVAWTIAFLLVVAVSMYPIQSGIRQSEPVPRTEPGLSSPVDSFLFESTLLGRYMPLTVILPPGYEDSDRRYPVLYMLHGLSGTNEEWMWYGINVQADRLMRAGEIAPMIIVLPQGDDGYWVDHADGGPRWGEYVAREVVPEVDANFRTLQSPFSRAVGGLSMGADGALQLAMSYPDVFGVAGAHSPVLRSYEIAPPYFGDRAFYDAHSPPAMIRAHPEVAQGIVIAIDVGVHDEWYANALALHDELDALGIRHEWSTYDGIHNDIYWAQHLPDYLRYYAANLAQ